MNRKFTLKFYFVYLFLLISFLSYSQQECHFSPGLKQKLQQTLDSSANSLSIKGISAAINLPDGKILTLVSGYSYDNVKVTPEMLFGAGSITKNFMATLAMQLIEDRRLSLYDPIWKYFPDHKNIDRNITIKELLNHTSGVYNYTDSSTFFPTVLGNPTTVWTPEELFTYVSKPNFTHGTDYYYSNTEYVILGCIIQKITGNTIAAELKKRFFSPLQLKSTVFYPDQAYTGELSHVFAGEADYFSMVGPSLFSCAWSSGAIVSTPSDLTKWSKALYSGKVIKRSSIQKMLEPSASNPNYGLGTMLLDIDGQPSYGHYGNILYNSYVNYFPNDKISIAVMENNAGVLAESVMVDLYKAYKSYAPQPQKPKIEISCYPVPFRNSITFNYELYSNARVALKISNIFGMEIAYFPNCEGQTGKHTLIWNGTDKHGKTIPVGLYYYTFIVDREVFGGIIAKQK
jgi:D-alanyl-D-alanine carboxypeptidase